MLCHGSLMQSIDIMGRFQQNLPTTPVTASMRAVLDRLGNVEPIKKGSKEGREAGLSQLTNRLVSKPVRLNSRHD
jgi:hypothetical protein